MSEKQPKTIGELVMMVSREVGAMVRSKKAHYGKYVGREQMIEMIQDELDKYDAFMWFKSGVDPSPTSSTRTTAEEVQGTNAKSGKPYKQADEKTTQAEGPASTLTMMIYWNGEEYERGTKAYHTNPNPQEDGKNHTYHSRYLMIGGFAIRIVEHDPDDAPVQPVQRKRRKMSDMNT